MTWLLFESPLALLIALVCVQFVLVAVWSRLRSAGTARAVWIGFAAIPILLSLSWLVVTPREHVIRVCETLAAAAEKGDVVQIGRYFASDVSAQGFSRDELLEQIDRVLSVYHVEQTKLSNVEVHSSGNDHMAEFGATCDVSTREGDLQRLPTSWRLTFRGRGDDLKITKIESIPVPPLQIRDLKMLLNR